MVGFSRGKRIAIVAAVGLWSAALAPYAYAQTASGDAPDPCTPAKTTVLSRRSTITVQPATAANKQVRWQRMGRNVEILLEDATADLKSKIRVCFAWQLAGGAEQHFVPTVVTNVDDIGANKKGLKVTAVVPDLSPIPSPYSKPGEPGGVYSDNGTYATPTSAFSIPRLRERSLPSRQNRLKPKKTVSLQSRPSLERASTHTSSRA